MFVGMNYINGWWIKHSPDFPSINPSTEEVIGLFPYTASVSEAVEAAHKAFQSWRKISRVARGEYFDRLCAGLVRRKNQIINLISMETGKNINESTAEFNESLHMAQYTFGMSRQSTGTILPSEIALKDTYVIRKPKGVVAVISPWNFPCAVGGFWCAAPAILEGNTVVFKPSEDSPILGQIIAELYGEAGFPPGVFNLIHGDGLVGADLVRHEKVNHICFTGSNIVGRDIQKVCAESWNKSCSCEMGGKSAVIVFDDADINLALEACKLSAFKLSGQRCVSAGRLLVQRKIYHEFLHKFADLAKNIHVGDPFEENTFMGPLISQSQRLRVEKINAQTKDTEVLLEGKRLDRKGWFLTPHVYTCPWGDHDFLKEEVFGPHVAIVPFGELEEAAKIYNDTKFGLSMAICTNDYRKMREMREQCDFGLGYVNLPCIGAESQVIFGGVKASGNGWPSAAGTFDSVVHKVTWTVNHDESFQMAQGLK